ncbi:hypothetical protein AVEN_200291-1 [Araneus ventricosus]|uniref:Uncharacterized protein n=1 Tax=Araneus ventricosus TaxID=182803 RepID=A0A4Y2HIP3_ARAVE|nr:hypothetical protein AVEN_200291-1 [Araneus ventricosus]
MERDCQIRKKEVIRRAGVEPATYGCLSPSTYSPPTELLDGCRISFNKPLKCPTQSVHAIEVIGAYDRTACGFDARIDLCQALDPISQREEIKMKHLLPLV